jgi:hypothetical protein
LGEADPPLTFRVSGWQYDDAKDSARIIRGALSRAAGDTAGFYEITNGGAHPVSAGSSYRISLTRGVLLTVIDTAPPVLLTLSLVDGAGREYWRIDSVPDAAYYSLPCDANDSVGSLMLRYTASRGVVVDSLAAKYVIAADGNTAAEGEVSVGEDGSLAVDMSRTGRRELSLTLRDTLSVERTKRYTVALERKFGLLDLVREHMGSLLVVHNNPELNGHGVTFTRCRWWSKRGLGEWDFGRVSPQLYYTAGSSIHDKFTAEDSVSVELYTADGMHIETCRGSVGSVGSVAPGSDSAAVSQSSSLGALPVYPNPVPAGGMVRLKQVEPIDGAAYARLYLLDVQGRVVFSGSASALRGGVTMPETSGVYHLVLEGNAGRKVAKIAVGQKE